MWEKTKNNCPLKQHGENERKNISEVFDGQKDLMQRFTANHAFDLKAGEIGVQLIGKWLVAS